MPTPSRTETAPALSVIIPANDEARHIGPCLTSVLSQTDLPPGAIEVIVAANGCTDDTADRARAFAARFEKQGWRLEVLDIAEGGKTNALNAACAVARSQAQAYLDADIVMDPDLLAQTLAALDTSNARYATGRMRVAQARSWVSRQYGKTWQRLPFMRPGSAPGAGYFAVNAAGRARWDTFPDIIADDTYVRWLFAPHERIEVKAGFSWPLVEGFSALVRVRARQDAGGRQLRARYPDLEANEGKPPVQLRDQLGLALGGPVSYATYLAVKLAVRLRGRSLPGWDRGAR